MILYEFVESAGYRPMLLYNFLRRLPYNEEVASSRVVDLRASTVLCQEFAVETRYLFLLAAKGRPGS
jgi:hypothetical protein